MRRQQDRSATSGEASQLRIEPGLHVMIQFAGSPQRHKGLLVGGEGEDYLLIRLLEPQEAQGRIAKGTSAVAGCVQLGTVHAFETEVLEHVDEPVPLLFMTYPERMQSHKLRGAARVVSNIPARARTGQREVLGRVVDLSAGGCRFSVKLQEETGAAGLAPGDAIELAFILPGGSGEQTIRGRVRSAKRGGGRLDLGLQFDQVDEAIQKKIHAYVYSMLEFDREDAA